MMSSLSLSREVGGMSVKITPLPDWKKRYRGGTKTLKLYFQISNENHNRFIRHWIDGHQQQFHQVSRTGHKSAYLWMDAALFEPNTAEEELSGQFAPALEKVGIVSSERRAEVVSKASEEVKGMMMGSVEKRRKVMVINVEIETDVIYRMFESELERAIWESNGSHGMVGADVEAASKMMRAVRIGEEGEEERECRICFEEMKEKGMGLPCEHLFHSDCILKWLQTSHYCPLCRFEMPTL